MKILTLSFAELSLKDALVFCIPASAANATAVNPNGIKTILAISLSTLSIKSKSVFSNGQKFLPRNPPNFTILDNWVFKNFMLADQPFKKTLRIV